MVPVAPSKSVETLKFRWKIDLDDLITKNKSNFIKKYAQNKAFKQQNIRRYSENHWIWLELLARQGQSVGSMISRVAPFERESIFPCLDCFEMKIC